MHVGLEYICDQIIFQDVNDWVPLFRPFSYTATITEDLPPGTPITQVTAEDMDLDVRKICHIENNFIDLKNFFHYSHQITSFDIKSQDLAKRNNTLK